MQSLTDEQKEKALEWSNRSLHTTTTTDKIAIFTLYVGSSAFMLWFLSRLIRYAFHIHH